MSRLIDQHDRFFKALLDRPGAAAALLRERLPPEGAALLAPDPPERLDTSFLDPTLAAHRADLLYKVRLRTAGEAFVLCLVEHKSAPDPRIALQLLRYMMRIWERCDAEQPGRPLPPILPLVIYHGAERWRMPPSLPALVAAYAALRPHLLEFCYSLADFGRIPIPSCRALKRNARDGELRAILAALVQAAQAQGLEFLVTVITYILAEPNQVDEAMVGEAVRRALPEQAERVMSIAAEQWLAQGEAKGRLEGRAEGKAEAKAETLLRQLGRRFGPLSEAVRARVLAADLATLDAWLDREIDAPDLPAVFAGATAD